MFWSSSKKAWPVCGGNCTYPEIQGGKCLPASQFCVCLQAHSSTVTISTIAVSSGSVRVINASWNSGSAHPCACTGTTGWLLLRFFFPYLSVTSNKGMEASWMLVFQQQMCPVCREMLGCVEGQETPPCHPSQTALVLGWQLLCSARCWVPTEHMSWCALGPSCPGPTSLLLTHMCAPLSDSSWWGWGASMGPAGSSGPDLSWKNLLPKGLKMSQSFKTHVRSPTSVWPLNVAMNKCSAALVFNRKAPWLDTTRLILLFRPKLENRRFC